MRCEDLIPPSQSQSGDLARWALVVAPDHRGELTKTKTSDDTVLLDGLTWLGPLLDRFQRKRAADDFLFPGDPAALRRQWQSAMLSLGVKDACLYQHRHGGASHDALSKSRPLLEIMQRGRWQATSSLLRYAKPGKVHRMFEMLDGPTQKFAEWCAAHLQEVVEGSLPAPLPPSLGGRLPPPLSLRSATASRRKPAAAASSCRAAHGSCRASSASALEAPVGSRIALRKRASKPRASSCNATPPRTSSCRSTTPPSGGAPRRGPSTSSGSASSALAGRGRGIAQGARRR